MIGCVHFTKWPILGIKILLLQNWKHLRSTTSQRRYFERTHLSSSLEVEIGKICLQCVWPLASEVNTLFQPFRLECIPKSGLVLKHWAVLTVWKWRPMRVVTWKAGAQKSWLVLWFLQYLPQLLSSHVYTRERFSREAGEVMIHGYQYRGFADNYHFCFTATKWPIDSCDYFDGTELCICTLWLWKTPVPPEPARCDTNCKAILCFSHSLSDCPRHHQTRNLRYVPKSVSGSEQQTHRLWFNGIYFCLYVASDNLCHH